MQPSNMLVDKWNDELDMAIMEETQHHESNRERAATHVEVSNEVNQV